MLKQYLTGVTYVPCVKRAHTTCLLTVVTVNVLINVHQAFLLHVDALSSTVSVTCSLDAI